MDTLIMKMITCVVCVTWVVLNAFLGYIINVKNAKWDCFYSKEHVLILVRIKHSEVQMEFVSIVIVHVLIVKESWTKIALSNLYKFINKYYYDIIFFFFKYK